MPEWGGLPHKSRSNDSSASARISGFVRVPHDNSSSHRQPPRDQQRLHSQSPSLKSSGTREGAATSSGSDSRSLTRRQRRSLWQVLFGHNRQNGSRRSTPPLAKQKDLKATSVSPPHGLLQRLDQDSQRSLRNEQAASKLAEHQLRQAVLGRSRQLSERSLASDTNAARRKGKPPDREVSHRSGNVQFSSLQEYGSLGFSAFQPQLQMDRREQANALTLKRAARQRKRHGNAVGRNQGLGRVGRLPTTDLKPFSKTQTLKLDQPTRPRSRSFSAGLYAARMLILSVGIGVLAGTLLSMVDPTSRSSAGASQQAVRKTAPIELTQASATVATAQGTPSAESASVEGSTPAPLPKLGQELATLKADLQTLALQTPQFTPGVFLFDLDSTAYLDLNGGASFAAASTIKVPILIAFFQDVDAGKIRLDELLTMRKELVAGGSGEMQGLPVGTQFTALETVTKMITISDNTATNMVIARLGGMSALDQRFRSWGLVSTVVNSMLPDLTGTNTTSPRDMALLMARISQGELVSMRSRDRLLDIMQRTVNRSQLPQGLGKGATIAHKTGDIGGMIGDVGLIDMPSGKRYALTVLIKRSFNDDRAYELVQQASRLVYQYLNRAPVDQNRPLSSPLTPSEPSSPQAGNNPTHTGSPDMPAETAINRSPSLDTAAR